MNPDYSYPGVYIEEAPTQPHPIDGVSTKTVRTLRAVAAHFRKRRRHACMLFTGAARNPKLRAARELARKLRSGLYRVELSEVVSKYIGETEKNLSALFAAAEQSNAVLFFDEADALFGKRSEVRDAHDRYANIEIAYLLQRIEQFNGVVILATTSKENLDLPFLRIVRFTISIPRRDRVRPAKPERSKPKDD